MTSDPELSLPQTSVVISLRKGRLEVVNNWKPAMHDLN